MGNGIKLIITPFFGDYIKTCMSLNLNYRWVNKNRFINNAEKLKRFDVIEPHNIIFGKLYCEFNKTMRKAIEVEIKTRVNLYKHNQWVSI